MTPVGGVTAAAGFENVGSPKLSTVLGKGYRLSQHVQTVSITFNL